MRRTAVLATAILIVMGGTVAPASSARKASGCSGSWTSSDTCTFRYKGGGYSAGIGLLYGAGAVLLQVENPVTGDRITLTQCATAGIAGACGAASSKGETDLHPRRGQKMYCVVTGRAQEGNFYCSTG